MTSIFLPLTGTLPRLKPIQDASSRQSAAPASDRVNLQQTFGKFISPALTAVVPRVQPPTPTSSSHHSLRPHHPLTHYDTLFHRDLHSPRIDLFRQTRCHLLHLRVPHPHTPSIWLILDRATTALILLPSKDMATSSECLSNSSHARRYGVTNTYKAPIRLPATSAAAAWLWIPTAAASMGPTAAAAAIPPAIPTAAPRQLRPGDDTVPIAAGADV